MMLVEEAKTEGPLTERVIVSLTPRENRKLKQAAESAGLSRSALGRQFILDALQEE